MMGHTTTMQALDAINQAINVVIAKSRSPMLINDRDDVQQSAMIKVLLGYDEIKGHLNMVRKNEIADQHRDLGLDLGYKNRSATPVAAYAYTVAYTTAMDYLRGRVHAGATHRNEVVKMDSPARHEDSEDLTTFGDLQPDRAPSAFDRIANMQRANLLVDEIEDLSKVQRAALDTWLHSDANLDGKTRINKMRAIDKITMNLPKAVRGKPIRSKHKGSIKAA